MRASIHRSLFLLPLLTGSPAMAQPAGDNPDIIVEGSRDQEKRIAEFVSALTKTPVGGQISRFEHEICPAAVGVPDAQKTALTRRLRQVAGAIGISVARSPTCAPNFLLVVTKDKQDLMQRLERKRPEYFPAAWSSWTVRDFARGPEPVAAWHFEGKMGRDGRKLSKDFDSGVDFQNTSQPPSRIVPSAQPYFLGAIIVVDVDALAGLTTTQLADYAAMRGFARTDPRALASSTTRSILHVINTPMGSEVPLTMTEWDFSFLKALYGSDGRNYASRQRSEMRNLVKQELDAGQANKQ